MEEILNLQKRRQEGPLPENEKEEMDLEETEKEEKNTQPWITVPLPKKRENKSKDSQPTEKPGTTKKSPTSTSTSPPQLPKHPVTTNEGKPQTQTLAQSQSQLPNRNHNNSNQSKPPPILFYESTLKTQTRNILERKMKNFYIKRINNNKKILQTETLNDHNSVRDTQAK
ncbi:hypothetical protein K0M31_002103 [Melipona bicolor]|uniref:Uncharacterized protein n=1 Tax=Melipona bicolor TaxID=60889 RepID=A0AA40KYH7_9HYME|nr:hypothetical protein K0M31_002103 [Melipona bicolor]